MSGLRQLDADCVKDKAGLPRPAEEGNDVAAGQPLIKLDDTKARAVLGPLQRRQAESDAEILENDMLIVDAQVDPKDRDVVRPGLPAEARFTAFSQRTAVPVKARVELVEDPRNALGGASIHPGMQSEVMIVTGQRTALSYLLRPVTRSLNRAFTDE